MSTDTQLSAEAVELYNRLTESPKSLPPVTTGPYYTVSVDDLNPDVNWRNVVAELNQYGELGTVSMSNWNYDNKIQLVPK